MALTTEDVEKFELPSLDIISLGDNYGRALLAPRALSILEDLIDNQEYAFSEEDDAIFKQVEIHLRRQKYVLSISVPEIQPDKEIQENTSLYDANKENVTIVTRFLRQSGQELGTGIEKLVNTVTKIRQRQIPETQEIQNLYNYLYYLGKVLGIAVYMDQVRHGHTV